MKNKLLIVGLCVGMALVSCKGKNDTDDRDTITTVDSTTVITDTTIITTEGASGVNSGTSSTSATGSGSGSTGSASGGTVSGNGATLDNSNPSAAGTTKAGINNDNPKGGTGAVNVGH